MGSDLKKKALDPNVMVSDTPTQNILNQMLGLIKFPRPALGAVWAREHASDTPSEPSQHLASGNNLARSRASRNHANG